MSLEQGEHLDHFEQRARQSAMGLLAGMAEDLRIIRHALTAKPKP